MRLFVSGAAGWQHELLQVREGGAGHGRDPAGAGGRLPPGLLRLQPVRGGAGGHRVPRDWRAGAVRDVPRLLREVSETVRQRGEGELD